MTAKATKTKRTKLFTIKCPACMHEFKVADQNNYVCTNCYERHAPDWIAAKAAKKAKSNAKAKPKVDKEGD